MSGEAKRASRLARFGATAIDFVLVPLVAILLMLVTGVLEHAEDWVGYQPPLRIFLLGATSYLLLNGWLLWKRGQTVGKYIIRIRIISIASGEKTPFWKLLFLRSWFFPVLYGFVFGWPGLMPLIDQAFIFGAQRRCLHDLICGTDVVSG